jgi:hypothetical protein
MAPGSSAVLVAVEPANLKAVPELISEIADTGSAFLLSPETLQCRLDLLAQARNLVLALETPRETMIKHLWTQVRLPFLLTCIPAEAFEAIYYHGHCICCTDWLVGTDGGEWSQDAKSV